ncbi:MAG: hypothetical protein NVSMB31_18140 [Vulcanimicrobiaceae bacterium]
MMFGDVPVEPGIFPDYQPHPFALHGNPNVKPLVFNFGTYADHLSVLGWYRTHLPQHGWHIDQTRVNYPVRGSNAIIATRTGEGLTVIVEGHRWGTRVSIIKLND